jgi:hypothetical protein
MAWRLQEHVSRGELDNRRRGRVTGRIWLAGVEKPLVLDLLGDCHPDLAGCLLRFENPQPIAMTTRAPAPRQRGTRRTQRSRQAARRQSTWPIRFISNGIRGAGALSLRAPTISLRCPTQPGVLQRRKSRSALKTLPRNRAMPLPLRFAQMAARKNGMSSVAKNYCGKATPAVKNTDGCSRSI